jgi:hypothetical protein
LFGAFYRNLLIYWHGKILPALNGKMKEKELAMLAVDVLNDIKQFTK